MVLKFGSLVKAVDAESMFGKTGDAWPGKPASGRQYEAVVSTSRSRAHMVHNFNLALGRPDRVHDTFDVADTSGAEDRAEGAIPCPRGQAHKAVVERPALPLGQRESPRS